MAQPSAQLPFSLDVFLKMPVERADKELTPARRWIQQNPFFDPKSFPSPALVDLLRTAVYVRRARGQTVIVDGRIADRFFVILSGSVVMHIPEPGGRAVLPRARKQQRRARRGSAEDEAEGQAEGAEAAHGAEGDGEGGTRPSSPQAAGEGGESGGEAGAERGETGAERGEGPAGEADEGDGASVVDDEQEEVVNRTIVARLFEGNLVGHMGVLRNRAWNATGVAEGPVHLLCFLKSDYDSILTAYHLSRQAHDVAEFLRTVPVFARWPPAALELVSAGVRPRTFERGAVVVARGDPSQWVFVVQDGELRLCDAVSFPAPAGAHRRAVRREWEVGSAGPRELIGDQEAIRNQPYRFRVVAATRVLALQVLSSEFVKHLNAHPQSLRVLTDAHEARDAARRERMERIQAALRPASRYEAGDAPLVPGHDADSAPPPPPPPPPRSPPGLLRASVSQREPSPEPPHAMKGPLSSPSDLARLGGPLPPPPAPASIPGAPMLTAAELAPVHGWAHGGARFGGRGVRQAGAADAAVEPAGLRRSASLKTGSLKALHRSLPALPDGMREYVHALTRSRSPPPEPPPPQAAPSPLPATLRSGAPSPAPSAFAPSLRPLSTSPPLPPSPGATTAAAASPSPVPPLQLQAGPAPPNATPGALDLEGWLEWLPQGPHVLAAATGAPLSVLYSEVPPPGPPEGYDPDAPGARPWRKPRAPRAGYKGIDLFITDGVPEGGAAALPGKQIPELRPVSKLAGPGGGGGGRGGPRGSKERKLDPLGRRRARPPTKGLLLSGY